jgi:hypothetical protein
MSVFNLKTAALAIVAGVGLSGCAYGPYGSGMGVGVGYGNGYGYDDYYDPYYGGGYYGANYNRYGYGYGSGYGQPYYGWYNGYYYPGSGYYVYDRDRRAHRWSDAQRKYWEWRRQGATNTARGGTGGVLQNWVDFQNGGRTANRTVRQRAGEQTQVVRREVTPEQRAAWAERRGQSAEQRAERAERRASRAETRSSRGTERRSRRETRND